MWKSTWSKVKEGRRFKLKEKKTLVIFLSSIFEGRFLNAHALPGATKDLTDMCANAPRWEDDEVGEQWSSLDINFIIQKNKYKIQKLKSTLLGN